MWDFDHLAELAERALKRRARALDREQSPYGLDALEETALHPILAGAYTARADPPLRAYRERPYPAQLTPRTPRTRDLAARSERDRCDLVLTLIDPARPDRPLADTVERVRDEREREASLFREAAPPVADPIDPSDACWIEVKGIAQYAFVAGVPGPSRAYASLLTRGPIADMRKLASDRYVLWGASLVVLFSEGPEVARHDLTLLAHRALDLDLPVGAPVVRTFGITERIGNTSCSVALFPVRKLPVD